MYVWSQRGERVVVEHVHPLSAIIAFDQAPKLSTDASTLATLLVLRPASYARTQLSLDMSKTTPTALIPSSDLQAIFEASLKEYEKKTEKSLVTHPLMTQLQACKSPTDILALLRSQAIKIEQATSADDKLIKWLDPIVNVLSASSYVISAGVGLVNTVPNILLRSYV